MADGPRYTFPPLERRGLLLGLGTGQLLTLGAGIVSAVVVHSAVGGSPGSALAVVTAAVSVVGAVWTRDGSSLVVWAQLALSWLGRRSRGVVVDPAPLEGRPWRNGPLLAPPGRVAPEGAGTTAAGSRRRGTGWQGCAVPGITLLDDDGLPGESSIAMIRDRRMGTLAGVMKVDGGPLSLLDPADQARQLEGWRQVLGAVCRTGSPVSRLQWVQRSWTGTDAGVGLSPPDRDGGVRAEASDSYQHVRRAVLPQVIHHDAWVALCVGGAGVARPPSGRRLTSIGRPPSAEGRTGDRRIASLRRELRLLTGQLTAAGLRPGEPLGPGPLGELLCRPHRPAVEAVRSGSLPWALAIDDRWTCCRTDGMWHATFWVAEWPRVEVGPDFMAPLLLTGVRVAVSVVMAPVPIDRAWRQVRSARTADVADAQLRSRAGFLASARRDREAGGVERREAELADGHHEFRYSGYVTISAVDPEQLVSACAEAEHAAQTSRLELRRLYGRQVEALTWTLPLGRGLR
ncbi:MAG: hypothetical protein M0Z30_14545 [Actinomycetota bacterium]|nr:hypothetical protein [Actinomycetota bacterium]